MSEPRKTQADHNSNLLLDCCQFLARLFDRAFADQLEFLTSSSTVTSRQKILDNIVQVGHACGMQTAIRRPGIDALASFVPAVAELSDESYVVVSKLSYEGVTLIFVNEPLPMGGYQGKTLPLDQFQQIWAGGILCFERINTALACFIVVAREHDIELTQNRLSHEFGLSEEEISSQRLLLMARRLGFKARKLHVSWDDIPQLKKACPVMARLKMVVISSLLTRYLLPMREKLISSVTIPCPPQELSD